MELKFFSIPARDSGAFGEELNRFLRGHRVLAVQRELVREDGGAWWAVCVEYLPLSPRESKNGAANPGKPKIDYRVRLNGGLRMCGGGHAERSGRACFLSKPALMKTIRLFLLCLLLLPFVAAAGTTEAESNLFAFDVRDSMGTTGAESAAFDLNARDSLVATSASSPFIMDTTGTAPQWLTITGQVRNTAMQPLPGASVELRRFASVFWTGTTGADGRFSIPTQVAAAYTMVVTCPGYLPRLENVSGTGNRHFGFVLDAGMVPPDLFAVNRVATAGELGVAAGSATDSVLKQLQGSNWSSPVLDLSKATVVICHGWQANPDGWVRNLGFSIANRAPGVNVVTWDWRNRAAGSLVCKIDVACLEGEELGKALKAALGQSYNQPIHFIGHSMGTLVNKYACDYLHGRNGAPAGWNANLTRPHLTLLDEAEIASVFGAEVVTSALIASAVANLKAGLLVGAVKSAQNWKNPIARDAVWVDNYISAVGFQRSEAVNVCLLTPSLTLGPGVAQLPQQFVSAHGYAFLWYGNTVTDAAANNGFHWSHLAGASLPPTRPGMTRGSVWWENLDTPSPTDVSRTFPNIGAAGGLLIANGILLDSGFPVLKAVSSYALTEAYKASTIPVRGVVQTVSWVGERTLDAMEKVGNVTIATVEKTGLWLDATADAAVDWFTSIDPSAKISGGLVDRVWKLVLRTPDEPPIVAAGQGVVQQSPPAPIEPGVWFEVPVPADAAFLSFDFAIHGEPADDVINCAVNGENVFSMPARFVDPDEITSTDLIDISQYAGQVVEFYFGLNGGTSHGCELVIEAARFVSLPPPSMRIERVPGGVLLDWPASATGWKPEYSPSLQEDDWHALPEDAAILEEGRAVMERTGDGRAMFYRLRREAAD